MPDELERQWIATQPVELPDRLGRFEALSRAQVEIVDRYYDTAERTLRASGATLRTRDAGGQRRATMKRQLPGDAAGGLRRRDEIETPIGPDEGDSDAFRAARGITDEPLAVVGELRNLRTTVVYGGGEATVEAVVDELLYPDGSRERRVEAEGAEHDVEAFASALEAAVAGLQPALTGKSQELARRGGT